MGERTLHIHVDLGGESILAARLHEVEKVLPRVLAISLDGVDDRAAVAPLLARCEEFGLELRLARALARDTLAPAFEHRSLEDALKG